MSKTNRRDFLKTSAVAAGALAAELAFSSGVHAAGNDVIKVGLVGCGGRGSGAASDCLDADPNLKLVAVGDAFPDRAKGFAAKIKKDYGDKVDIGDRVFVGLKAYQQVIAESDLVILATPPGFRPIHIAAVIAAKKHLFTEKPVAVDGPGIRTVLEAYKAANDAKLCVVAGTQRRHQQGYLEAMKRIWEGDIGEIRAARCYWNQEHLWHKVREPKWSDLEWQVKNWLYFTWLSGDHIVEQHVHNLDVINWAMKDHPKKAQGMGGRQVRTGPEFGHIFDHFAVEYEYPNGVHLASQCRQIDGTKGNVSEWLVGTKGVWGTVSESHELTGEKPWKFDHRKETSAYKLEHRDLIKHIREGNQINELQNVAYSTLTAIMGRMAAYTGQEVTWEAALNSKQVLMPQDLSFDMTLPVPEVAMPGKTKLI
jgi:predicted dehydrogenase